MIGWRMNRAKCIRKSFGQPGNGGFATTCNLICKIQRPLSNRRLQRIGKTRPKAHKEGGHGLVQFLDAGLLFHGQSFR